MYTVLCFGITLTDEQIEELEYLQGDYLENHEEDDPFKLLDIIWNNEIKM